MSAHRFFVDPKNIRGNEAVLSRDEAYHLKKVLRLEPGARVTLFDGTGNIHDGTISTVSNQHALVNILATRRAPNVKTGLHLGIGILKGKKMSLVLQKATELGVDCITPFFSQYSSVTRVDKHKSDRWRRICQEACKQCNRAVPPVCQPVTTFDDIITASNNGQGLKLILWEKKQGKSLDQIVNRNDPPPMILFLVGPEGGFSDEEFTLANRQGFLPVTIGERILRAETAAIAATVLLQFLTGSLGISNRQTQEL